MMRLKLAIRNITRHGLRSSLSIIMIAGAIVAVILFQGFAFYSIDALQKIAAENQYGNMQIATHKYWAPGKENRSERLFALDDLKGLTDKFPQAISLSGRLSFFGLISTGEQSVGAKMIGVDPIGEPHFIKSLKINEGKFLESNTAKEVIVGHLLAKQMNVHPGDSITLLGNTIDGVINAMDLTVVGNFSAGIDEIDAQIIYLPLSVAQEIIDTKNVDIAVLKFKELPMAQESLDSINSELKATHPTLFAKSWHQLANLFRQVDSFYKVQNNMVESILLVLMFLGILNTVSMTVVERTGEIGTLRALGESRKEIVLQFVLESIILSMIGIIGGVVTAFILVKVIDSAKIMTDLPGATLPIQIKIFFMFSSVLYSSFLASITTIIATLIPAVRASRLDIVEALRKNI